MNPDGLIEDPRVTRWLHAHDPALRAPSDDAHRSDHSSSALILDGSEFVARAQALRPARFDRVLELVGNKVVRESLQLVKPVGALCLAGFLGLDAVDAFNPMFDLPSDVRLSFFGSFVLGSDGYRTQDIPMQEIVDGVTRGRLAAKPARVLPFDAIAEAHRLVEANSIEGKIVIEV